MKKTLVALLALTSALVSISCSTRPARTTQEEKISAEDLKKVLERRASFDLPQFPVGFWNYAGLSNDVKIYDEWLDTGFTMIMTPFYFGHGTPEAVERMRHMLKWGYEHDMRFVMYDLRVRDKERWQQSLKDYAKNPAVAGFFIADEPRGRDGNKNAFADSRRLKEVAPQTRTFISFGAGEQSTAEWLGYPSWPNYLEEMATKPKLDSLWFNSYGLLNEGTVGWDIHFYNLRMVRETTQRHGLSFWITLCCVAHGSLRIPSYADLRWQFNSAVCSGASGVMWYLYYTGPFQNYRFGPIYEGEKTKTYYDLRRVMKSFHRRYKDLFVKLTPTRVTFSPKAWGGGKVFTPNELIAKIEPEPSQHPLLIGEFVDLKGQRYVMIVNNCPWDSVRVVVTFADPNVKLYSWNWDGEEYRGGAYSASSTKQTDQGLEVTHWLAPGQEAVYRVDSDRMQKAKSKTQ